MLDPVDHESCSRTKPNSRVDQRISSSASRLTSTPSWAQTKANSATKSRAAVPSIEFGLDDAEAELGGHRGRVEPEGLAGQRARAVRRVEAGRPVGEPVDVADQRPRVREQVVGEQHRLGVLQVGPARHHRTEVDPALGGQRVDQGQHLLGEDPRVVAQEHAQQRGDLVVAGPAGAQPAADLGADLVEQQPLQGAVHVLVGLGSRERPRVVRREESVEPGLQRAPGRRR